MRRDAELSRIGVFPGPTGAETSSRPKPSLAQGARATCPSHNGFNESQHRTQPRIALAGGGALGSALLDRLRGAGYPSVLVVDPDEIAERNLVLSPLLRRALEQVSPEPCDGNKARLLAEAAQTLDRLQWQAAACEIADVGWQDLQAVDLICCCTDSVLSRVETSWIARSLGKPMIDAGVFGQDVAAGRVTVFSPLLNSACFLCGLSENRRAAVLGYAASTSLGCQVSESIGALETTLETLNRVADAIFARIAEWRDGEFVRTGSTRLVQMADGAWRGERFELSRSATCPWHETPSARLRGLPWEEPLSVALTHCDEIILNWPVCTRAVCAECGTRTEPMRRVASVRHTLCSLCGRAAQHPLEALHRIRRGDLHSSLSPRQLGMPDRHLYWMQNCATGEFVHKGKR